jgi:hypothetical protein
VTQPLLVEPVSKTPPPSALSGKSNARMLALISCLLKFPKVADFYIDMIFTPDGHAGLDKGFFLSRTGNCKPFDDNADGYCRAEGVGTLFMKRLEDALADNDPILAVILDTKTNHSAMSDSMTRPHAGAQIDNMTAVLNTACVHPNDISYIEMHGTGTQVCEYLTPFPALQFII